MDKERKQNEIDKEIEQNDLKLLHFIYLMTHELENHD